MITEPDQMGDDPHRPLEDVERYLLEDYYKTILPGFAPFEHVNRNASVMFQDSHGVGCVIGAGEIVASFLALADLGFLPPVTEDWLDLVPDDLHPEPMLARKTPASIPLPPRPDQADPALYTAQFVALAVHDRALSCCGTRAYAVLRTPVSEHRISERNCVAAMHQLALANDMPPLSAYWQSRMDMVYEPRRETDIRSRTPCSGELRGD